MNQDLMNQLQQIASGKVYSGSDSYDKINEVKAGDLKRKLNQLESDIKQMYPTKPEKVFETFKQQTKNIALPTDSIKEFYWNKYLDMHPDGRDAAKSLLVRQTEQEMDMFNSPAEKEFFLRDKVSRFPSWLTKEFKGDIQNLSFRNSYSNLSKSKQVYKDDLSKRLSKLADRQLDPDVGEEAHVNDLMKLEKMNLMDVADSLNGRFGVADKNGNFNPAFDLKDRSQVFPNQSDSTPGPDEQLMVDDLAPPFIRDYVKGNLANQRSRINMDNKASEGVAGMMLEQGKFTMDKWGEAFSMFAKPDYTALIERGLKGEINSGRVRSDEDLTKAIYMATNQYKDLLGDTNNATNA